MSVFSNCPFFSELWQHQGFSPLIVFSPSTRTQSCSKGEALVYDMQYSDTLRDRYIGIDTSRCTPCKVTRTWLVWPCSLPQRGSHKVPTAVIHSWIWWPLKWQKPRRSVRCWSHNRHFSCSKCVVCAWEDAQLRMSAVPTFFTPFPESPCLLGVSFPDFRFLQYNQGWNFFPIFLVPFMAEETSSVLIKCTQTA